MHDLVTSGDSRQGEEHAHPTECLASMLGIKQMTNYLLNLEKSFSPAFTIFQVHSRLTSNLSYVALSVSIKTLLPFMLDHESG